MKYLSLLLLFIFTSLSLAQEKDTTSVKTETMTPAEVTTNVPKENKWYYGGTIGFNFWQDYFYLSLNPLIGYQVSPKFSVGGKLMYAYINDKRYDPFELTSHNYGASVFSRFRPIYQIYLHAEFAYASFEDYTIYSPLVGEPYVESERNWVPFLLLGGGYVQRIGPNAALYIEILFDVINDENSPYEEWDPIISIGGGVGF